MTLPVRLSVIVVTWNAKHYVEQCLASLQQLSETPPEIIVVDNASSDGTPELIREHFPQVHLIRSDENCGFARGNNIGIQHSHGDYIALVNSDVIVPAGCFDKILAYMDCNSDVGLLGPQMVGPDGSIRRSTMRNPTLWNLLCRALALDRLFQRTRWAGGFLMRDFPHDRTQVVEVLNGWFWVARRQALKDVGPLDGQFFMYGEDLDWCYRFQKEGWRLVFFAGARAIHFGGGSSAAAPLRFHREEYQANLKYWRKHHGRASTAAYAAVAILHEMMRIAGHSMVALARPRSREESTFKVLRSANIFRWL